jgi:hypothetical protein
MECVAYLSGSRPTRMAASREIEIRFMSHAAAADGKRVDDPKGHLRC